MDVSGVDVFSDLIKSLGFPIFVAGYMLIKGSKDSADLRTAINELTTMVKLLNSKVDKDGGDK